MGSHGLAIAPDDTSYPFWTDVRIGVASGQNRHSGVRIDILLPEPPSAFGWAR